MNLVDSSCWLEFFAGSPVGELVSEPIENTHQLIVPAIVLYEVFKKLLAEVGEDNAIMALAHMKQGKVVDLDAAIAIQAVKLGFEHKLALADSIIYATAVQHGCLIWTQDKHFEKLDHVRYFRKR